MEREDKEGKAWVRVAHWVRKLKDDYKNHPSYQSLIKKYGQMPGGYWNLDGWKGHEDARALYTTYIGNGKKLPKITDPSATATGLRVDELHQGPMETELLGIEIGNPNDDSVEDIQSAGEDSIDRLIGHMNINKKGKLGEVDEVTHVYQDTVGDTELNEDNTSKHKQSEKIAAYNWEGQTKNHGCPWVSMSIRSVKRVVGAELSVVH